MKTLKMQQRMKSTNLISDLEENFNTTVWQNWSSQESFGEQRKQVFVNKFCRLQTRIWDWLVL